MMSGLSLKHGVSSPDIMAKVNVDAAIWTDSAGIGAVFRDHWGRFSGGFAKNIEGSYDP